MTAQRDSIVYAIIQMDLSTIPGRPMAMELAKMEAETVLQKFIAEIDRYYGPEEVDAHHGTDHSQDRRHLPGG